MECNKDEAARAKTIAEKKLQDRDFAGAKKFALKAQNLYPPLEGLSQILTTLDVYVAAENKISGEIDWYGVLGVAPSADDETIRKQYRKLALMLHPDKNKSVGADGAFKLLSEAWGLLSDKGKRLAYNQRRSSRGFQHKVPSQTGRSPAAPNGSQTGRPPAAQSGIGSQTGRPPAAQSGIGSQTGRPAAAPGGIGSQTGRPAAAPSGIGSQTGKPSAATSGNGFHNFTNRAQPKPKTHKSTVPPPAFRRADTFWTICHNCKMHYEYLRVYLNHTLLCPNCHQAFMAAEMAPPANFPKSSNSSSQQSHQNINNHAPISKPGKSKTTSTQNVRQGGSAGPNLGKHSNSHSGSYSNVAGTSNTEPSIAAKAANVIQQVNERLKREREESQGSVFKGEGPSKRRVVDSGNHYHGDKLPFKAPASDGTGLRSISGLHGVSAVNNSRPNGTRELTLLETRNMLMEKALKEVKKKLSEWNTEAANKAEEKRKVEQRKKEQMKIAMKSDEKLNVVGESSLAKDETAEHFNGTSVDSEDKEESVALSMNVPDPDFHDFDMDRTESSFGDNQTWAAYDDDDGMPRFYAFIHKVISRKPFKMKISWLNSKTNSEFGPLEWVTSGFSKTCGEFRVGKYEVNKSLNSFSHKVKWTKARGVLQILPKKGDVWALYRNWSHDWNEHTPDEVIHKYDMVQVLDDYNEEGVSVTSLIKVAGFRTVFHPQQDSDKVMRIPKEEMFRFSHQVPHYILTGQEAKNAPKGFLELDPAATPLELLQVITEADTLSMKKGANFKEELQGTAATGVVETAEGSEAEKGQMV